MDRGTPSGGVGRGDVGIRGRVQQRWDAAVARRDRELARFGDVLGGELDIGRRVLQAKEEWKGRLERARGERRPPRNPRVAVEHGYNLLGPENYLVRYIMERTIQLVLYSAWGWPLGRKPYPGAATPPRASSGCSRRRQTSSSPTASQARAWTASPPPRRPTSA